MPPDVRLGNYIGLGYVKLRGFPFKTNEDAIRQFFWDLKPVEIHLLYEYEKPAGEAFVVFNN